MLNSFEISKIANEKYDNTLSLSENLMFGYANEKLFNKVEQDDRAIFCYGYCLDVRNPKTEVSETLNDLLSDPDNFEKNLKYLNGHFVLVFNVNGSWSLLTDAMSFTQVYYDSVNSIVTTHKSTNSAVLDGHSILNLNDFTINNIEVSNRPVDEVDINRIVIESVKNQYNYFIDKDFSLNFRRDELSKSIIAILHPVLFGKTLILKSDDDVTNSIGSQLANEYKMNLDYNDNHEVTYLAKAYLLAKSQDNLEDEKYLIFNPFNTIAIQEIMIHLNDQHTVNLLNKIISELHPALDFYDFDKGDTLLKKYTNLKKEYEKILKEAKKDLKNEEFLQGAEDRGIKVTDNLTGTIQNDGLTFYPASQNISKNDQFEVTYRKQGAGMVLVESYFDNIRNAHRIKVNLNGEQFDINEFLNGKFINVGSEINIKMTYERDYDSPSWQKAGKITIKEID